jgi:hypothetical protein
MGALTALNISNNLLTKGVLKSYPGYTVAGSRYKDEWGRKNGDYNINMEGVVALGDAIRDNGAMTSLDVSNNMLYAKGTALLAEALKGNQVMELNLSSNSMTVGGMSGVVALADAIPDMGALASFNLASNSLGVEGAEIIAAVLRKCT